MTSPASPSKQLQKKTTKTNDWKLWLSLGALASFALAFAALIALPSLIKRQIAKRVTLAADSSLYERWSKPNVPMLLRVWLFDVQNAEELLLNASAKLHVRELGPFAFRMQRVKYIAGRSDKSVFYTERKLYHFEPSESCCSLNVSVTVPNVPLAAIVDRAMRVQLHLVRTLVPRLVNRAIQSLRERVFVRKQVRELLFDGYEVELLKVVAFVGSLVGSSSVSSAATATNPNSSPNNQSQQQQQQQQQRGKFSLFANKNNTWRPEVDGTWAINTGVQDHSKLGQVDSWNGAQVLKAWGANSACNAINGSDGTLFPPPISSSSPLFVFNPEICRTVSLEFEAKAQVHGIETLKFVISPKNFAATMERGTSEARYKETFAELLRQQQLHQAHQLYQANQRRLRQSQQQQTRQLAIKPNVDTSDNEKQANVVDIKDTIKRLEQIGQLNTKQHRVTRQTNESLGQSKRGRAQQMSCFCDRKDFELNKVNICEFDGLIDLSKCSRQAQVVFGSPPHFVGADQRLKSRILGLEPNASKHTSYMQVEPTTGIVVGGKRRLQLNLAVRRNAEIEAFQNIPDMLVPVLWLEESAEIPKDAAAKMREMLYDKVRRIKTTLVSLIIVSICVLLISVFYLLPKMNIGKKTQRVNKENTNLKSDTMIRDINHLAPVLTIDVKNSFNHQEASLSSPNLMASPGPNGSSIVKISSQGQSSPKQSGLNERLVE